MFLSPKKRQFCADRPNFDCHEREGGDPQVYWRDRDRKLQLDEFRRQIERQYFWVRPFCL
ncbi:MAG: hypothetical protein ACP5D7_22645 [Limnospira sp.]